MKNKKMIAVAGVVAFITLVSVLAVGRVSAQSPTPTTPAPNAQGAQKGGFGLGRGLGFGGSTEQFDAIAKALNLTPTQLFEQLHSGKSLEAIAQAQGVDLQKVQDAAKASRLQAMKDAITQAVKDGKMTQAQADWMLQGLENGYLPQGRGGFGHGGRGGRGGFDQRGPAQTPATPTPGATT